MEEVKIQPLDVPQEKEPSSFRLIATLGVAGFLSGLILVSTYIFTKPIIEENKARALREAIFEVLPGTDTFTTLLPDGDGLRELAEGETFDGEAVFLGFNAENKMTGFAISGEEGGYQDIIGAIYGFNPNEKIIIGFKVLESKETPGLGDKIFKDADFQTNFTALQVNPEIEVVKKGEKTADNQVEAISGVTISSKAIVRLLNKTMVQWQAPIDKYLETKNNSGNE